MKLNEKTLEQTVSQLTRVREAGRVLSASNRDIVTQIKSHAAKIDYHPTGQKISALCEQLLAAADGNEETVKEASLANKVLTSVLTSVREERVREAASWEQIQAEVADDIRARFEGMPDPDGDGDDDIPCSKDPSTGRMTSSLQIVATYADHAIFTGSSWDNKIGAGGSYFSIPYTVDGEGEVTLGNPTEVTPDFTPVRESVGGRLLESVDPQGKEWDVAIIETGLSRNGTYYGKSVLQEAVPLFEGIPAFADHATDRELAERPERSIRDKIGTYKDARYDTWTVNGRVTEGIRARLKVIAPWAREALLEAYKANEPDFLGFSIDGDGRKKREVVKEAGSQIVTNVTKLLRVRSTDIVTDASAGGRLMRLVASNRSNKGESIDMDPKELAELIAKQVKEAVAAATVSPAATATSELADVKAELVRLREADQTRANYAAIDHAVSAANLSEISKERVAKLLRESAKARLLESSEIDGQIKEAVDFEARLIESTGKRGMYPSGGNGRAVFAGVSGMIDPKEKLDLAMLGMWLDEDQKDASGAAIPRFSGIREAYGRWYGIDSWSLDPQDVVDEIVQGTFRSRKDHARIRESLSSASWGSIYADNLYIVMLRAYATDKYSRDWQTVVSEFENVPDFQSRHWTRIGGYSDLSTVAEQGTYPPIAIGGNEAVNYSVAKRGGIDDVTFEAIVNDRFGAIRRIPVNMGRAAARTLYKFVLNMVTTQNPAMTLQSDTNLLYDNTNHFNSSAIALSVSGLATVRVNMRKQTAYGETQEILGPINVPKIVIVSGAQESLIQRILDPSGQYVANVTTDTNAIYDPALFKGKGLIPIVYDVLTDSDDWWAVADPSLVETMIVGFLNGQREPELYVQDQPTVGANFSADKVSYKVRHIYGGVIAEWRSFYQCAQD